MSVQMREFAPSKPLQPFVEFYWQGDFNTPVTGEMRQQVVPNGYVELIIHLTDRHCNLLKDELWTPSPDYTIIGLYTKPYEVRFDDLVQVFGIRFKPEGVYNLFGVPASEFKQDYEDMELVLDARFGEFCERLREAENSSEKMEIAEDYLRKSLDRNTRDLSYVNRAAEIIRATDSMTRIEDLPDEVYISLRQLEREFKHKIGIPPKRYMRIARLNKVHRLLEADQELEFTKVAFDCGYADQAHFIRDFKSIMGVKPTVFVKRKKQFIVNPNRIENAQDE